MNNTKITGVGHYIPEKVVNNEQLSDVYGVLPADIVKKTGILERRYVEDNESTTDIVYKAVIDLLEKSSTPVEDIECLIVGTLTPDYFFPSTAVAAINKLKAKHAWGFDLSAACSGFCYGLSVAHSMIQQGSARKVVVCAADRMSKTINNFDYKTALLFGDGAAAVLLEETKERHATVKGSFNKVVADDLTDVFYRTPFNTDDWPHEKFELEGGKVYRSGVALTARIIRQYFDENALDLDDFDHIIPHQSNLNMIRDTAIALGGDSWDRFRINIQKIGNTGGASIPVCLSEYVSNGTIKRGDRVLLASFGAGYTVGINDFVWAR